ncbi:MAG TPA: C4-type zinc ribbon domain-containing protein [Ilumatobacteraceae bacterium]|nr:C4-type zinc ribbon domain-containing protein [Ilumatobacteraceae bacterium]
MSDTADNAPSTPTTIPELLLALQGVDTQADQLAHRREHSPLRDDLAGATAVMLTWEQQRAALRSRIDELGTSIEAAEQRGAELLAHRQRLEQQMKTVIAPREAEALMHEMDTLTSQIDELDGQELNSLEEQSTLDDRLSEHLGGEEQLRKHQSLADDAFAAEVRDIDNELAALVQRRIGLRDQLPDPLLVTYDRKRAALGVAVAPLVGKQCQGCHLELSAAEIDTVKDEAADTGVTDCPDCGRLLIV